MRLRILYDNDAFVGTPAHGFSCFIQKENKALLFDAGWDCSILLGNARKLGIELEKAEKMVISHAHWDHMGSLPALLPLTRVSKVELCFPTATEKMREELARRAIFTSCEEPTEIVKDVYTTGVLGRITKEQSLVIKGRKGLIVITGCAHPGLELIMERAREIGNDEIYAVIGGFHGFAKLDLLEELKLIVPCHCTVRKKEILKKFPQAKRCGIGLELEF